MSFLDERRALTREKRVSAVSHFDGSLEALRDEASGDEIKQKIRTLSQVTYDEVLFAIKLLGTIKDTAIVVHGAIGCAAGGIGFHAEHKIRWYSTNLGERDTILGGDEKLRRAVTRAVNETRAKVIFVVGTPVVAINNDDVNSMILELEDELEVKIISIYTDGFKSKTPVTGYDIITHSLLRNVIESSGEDEKEDFVNLISYSENPLDIAAIAEVLDEAGIKYNLLPQFGSVAGIKKAARAKASIVLNPDEGSYLAKELAEVYGVSHICSAAPIGVQQNRRFFTRLGKVLGKEEEFATILAAKEESVDKSIRGQYLAGKKVFLSATPARAVGLVELVEKLGGTVTGLALPYIDLESREYIKKLSSLKPGTPIIVASGQGYELSNVIAKGEFDYYITEDGDTNFAAVLGLIPVVTKYISTYGYRGIDDFAETVRRASEFYQNKTFFYKQTWLKKSSNWYVKQEVR